MRINKFKKVGTNKYRIYFDSSSLLLYEDVILKYNLLYKKEIDSDLLIEIDEENKKASIYDTALKYIGIRMRSIKEMKEYLIRKKFDSKDIDNTINKLIEQGLLNDKLFSKAFVNDKINLTNNGIDKIRNDLEKLGVEDSYIEEALNNVDKNILLDKLNKIIEKEVRLNSKLPTIKMKNKIINRCINLGYKLEDINNILNNYDLISNSNIKTDYDKLYNKYCNKYDEYKLKSVLKSKLYQKGYSIEEINRIVD